jgi:hypothetical protein
MEEAEKYLGMAVGQVMPVAQPNLPSVENQARVSVDGRGAESPFKKIFVVRWPPIGLDN